MHFYQFVIKLDLNFINLYLFRRNELEKKLEKEDISDERKNRQLQSLGRKESSFLRLRRTRLGLEDFVTVKVIGKGAFGEVCNKCSYECISLTCLRYVVIVFCIS